MKNSNFKILCQIFSPLLSPLIIKLISAAPFPPFSIVQWVLFAIIVILIFLLLKYAFGNQQLRLFDRLPYWGWIIIALVLTALTLFYLLPIYTTFRKQVVCTSSIYHHQGIVGTVYQNKSLRKKAVKKHWSLCHVLNRAPAKGSKITDQINSIWTAKSIEETKDRLLYYLLLTTIPMLVTLFILVELFSQKPDRLH
jgi:hypothetical protein